MKRKFILNIFGRSNQLFRKISVLFKKSIPFESISRFKKGMLFVPPLLRLSSILIPSELLLSLLTNRGFRFELVFPDA